MEIDLHVTKAFDDLSGPVFGYVIVIVGDRDGAEDVTQEVFFRYFCELRQGREIREPRAWAFRVAHNLALNQRRDSRKFVRISDCRIVAESRVHQRLEELERRRQVRRALAALSSRERRCIELRTQGLRYREIADLLHIRISSVSNYVERAIRKITHGLEACRAS